eukprot:8356111-Pyramimonas_sp.AAC.2
MWRATGTACVPPRRSGGAEIQRNAPPFRPPQVLAEEAQIRWVQNFGGEVIVDDVSIAIVWLDQGPERHGKHHFVDLRML